jgi:hypothetical protein
MPFNFERFTDTESSYAARITIRQTGQFGFNTGALNRFKIKDYSSGVLYYDAGNRVVGIELSATNQQDALEIKKGETNTFLRAKNFCDKYSIDYSKSRRYELRKDEESGFLYFDLQKELDPKEDVADATENSTDGV